MRRSVWLLLILVLMLAACGEDSGSSNSNTSGGGGNNDSPPAATTPEVTGPTLTAIVAQSTQAASGVASPEPFALTATALVAQATANANNPVTNCETGLLTNTDAGAAGRFDAALASAGVDSAASTVLVTENVLDCQTRSIVNAFISVPVTVGSTTDDATLGAVVASILAVFINTDLPQPATLSMQFQAGSSQRSLSANFDVAQQAVNDGLTGAVLIELLGG